MGRADLWQVLFLFSLFLTLPASSVRAPLVDSVWHRNEELEWLVKRVSLMVESSVNAHGWPKIEGPILLQSLSLLPV